VTKVSFYLMFENALYNEFCHNCLPHITLLLKISLLRIFPAPHHSHHALPYVKNHGMVTNVAYEEISPLRCILGEGWDD
jgi:fumarate reductase subunit D